jgi:succinyl-diaminopimelate desuccinylase
MVTLYPLPDLSDPVAIARIFLRCQTVTPDAASGLDAMQAMLEHLGFDCQRHIFGQDKNDPVDNLFALYKGDESAPSLLLAGHMDVVPAGDTAQWSHDPFGAEQADGFLYGRGSVDMKGALAAMVAAVARFLANPSSRRPTLGFLITGDEEGPALHGTEKLLDVVRQQGHSFDFCLLGEPTNPEQLGTTIKAGRRGSLSVRLTVKGEQGHVAYPHLAANPVRALPALLSALLDKPLDEGTEHFDPSNLEPVSLTTGTHTVNVIPGTLTCILNCRFNDLWTAQSLFAELESRLQAVPTSAGSIELEMVDRPSEAFLTMDHPAIGLLQEAVCDITGRRPELSTSGGTSDARFIKDYVSVIEFGLVSQTMHKVDECVSLEELEHLTRIYQRFIEHFMN